MSHQSTGLTRRHRISVAVLTVALILTITLPAVAAPAGPAALPLIDDFNSDQTKLTSTGSAVSSSVADVDVLGGWRDIYVDQVSGTGSAAAEVAGGASEYRFSTDTDTIGQSIVQWDGTTGYGATPGSFTAQDLTQGGLQGAIAVTCRFNDLPTTVTFRVYSGPTNSNWSTLLVNLPGGQTSGAIDYYWPFTAFTTGGGSGATFSSVTAVEMIVNGTVGADLTLHNVRTSSFNLDFGDLPATYFTGYSSDGPRHRIGSLFLGAAVDSETDGIPSAGADSDDTSGATPDDEDGIAPTPGVRWVVGPAGGSVNVTVTGGPGCLSGWIDWDRDGSFFGTGEPILDRVLVSGSNVPHTFGIPALTTPIDFGAGPFYAWFRLFPTVAGGGCGDISKDYLGFAENGEVEDYAWTFTATAVTLSGMSAMPAASPLALPLGLVTLLGVLVGGIVLARRPV